MFFKDKEISTQDFDIKEDDLLQCAKCKMVVHRRCYPTHRFQRSSQKSICPQNAVTDDANGNLHCPNPDVGSTDDDTVISASQCTDENCITKTEIKNGTVFQFLICLLILNFYRI
jgi:hypothetical protein